MSALSDVACQGRANEKLDLMVKYERQDDEPHDGAWKQETGHRHACRKGFFRSTEHQRDDVFVSETAKRSDTVRHGEHEHEREHVESAKKPEIRKRNAVPQSFNHGLAESGIDHQDNGATVA